MPHAPDAPRSRATVSCPSSSAGVDVGKCLGRRQQLAGFLTKQAVPMQTTQVCLPGANVTDKTWRPSPQLGGVSGCVARQQRRVQKQITLRLWRTSSCVLLEWKRLMVVSRILKRCRRGWTSWFTN